MIAEPFHPFYWLHKTAAATSSSGRLSRRSDRPSLRRPLWLVL
jgi:hypothetical protein